jgi:predicted enzyme related to lactoylglutathione lyase
MSKFSKQASGPGAPAAPSPLSRRQLLASATLMAAVGMISGRAAPAQAGAPAEVGTVWWSELQTANPARARAFYAGVMGWTPKVVALEDSSRPPAAGEKEYSLFNAGGQDVAGAVHMEDGPADVSTPMWLTYIQVANVDAAAKRAVELGGKLLEAPADVPNTGRIAIIEDLEGVRVGLITPSTT